MTYNPGDTIRMEVTPGVNVDFVIPEDRNLFGVSVDWWDWNSGVNIQLVQRAPKPLPTSGWYLNHEDSAVYFFHESDEIGAVVDIYMNVGSYTAGEFAHHSITGDSLTKLRD